MGEKERLSQKREAINSLKSQVSDLIKGIEESEEEYESKLQRKEELNAEISSLEATLAEKRKEVVDIDAAIKESDDLRKSRFQSLMDVVQKFGSGLLESEPEEEMVPIVEQPSVEEKPEVEEETEGTIEEEMEEIEEEVDYLPQLEELEIELDDIDEAIFEDDEESDTEEQLDEVVEELYIQDDEEEAEETEDGEQEENLTEEERLRRMLGDITEIDDNGEEKPQIVLEVEDDLEGVGDSEKEELKKRSAQTRKKGLFGLRRK